MFIHDQIKDEITRDVNLQFTQRNPEYKDSIPGNVRYCVLPPLMYLSRWIAFYRLRDLVH